MRVDISDGKIHINVMDLMESIDKDSKIEIIDALAISDDVISFVADQILHEWTPLDSRGYTDCVLSDTPGTPINQARRRIAKESGEVARKEIEGLERAIRIEKDRNEKLLREISELKYRG